MSIVDAVFTQGIEAYQAGDYAAAERAFQEVLNQEPYSSEAMLNLGNVYFQDERFQEAEALWLKAVRINPMEDKAYLNLGNLYYSRESYQKAVDYWKIFQKLHPEHATIHLNLGLAYEALCRMFEAFQYYNRFLALQQRGKDYVQLKRKLLEAERVASHNIKQAEMYMRRGMLEQAREAYEKTVSIVPLHSKIYQHYGTVLYRLNQLKEAAHWYERAVAQAPEDSGIYANLGVIYEKLTERFQALWAYFTAIKLDPHGASDRVKEKFAELWEEAGPHLVDTAIDQIKAHIEGGRYEEAEILTQRAFEVAFQVDPQKVTTIKGFMAFLEERKDPKLLAANIAFALAEDFYQNGQYEKALRFYDRYLVLLPEGDRAEAAQNRQEEIRRIISAVIGSMLTGEKDSQSAA